MEKKYEEGQKVDLIILRETDLGYVAKVNGEDGKLDLILQPFGNFGTDDLSNRILEILEANNGFLPVTDKTDAQEIYNTFGVSKKKFKMALGNIYKKRMITLEPGGIRLKKKT